MEKQIQVAAKMYNCRTAAKKLLAENYTEKISFYKTVLRGTMRNKNMNEVEAAYDLCKDEQVQANGMAVLLFMAAAVDISEE